MGLTLAMTLTLNFQDQVRNLLYQMTKYSENEKWILIEHEASNEAITFYLRHDLDLGFFKAKF